MIKTLNNRSWIARGGWSLADQACFALANVLLNLLLARWLSPSQFGAFAVGYSLFLFLGAIHTALITEPMLVFGSNRYSTNSNAYLRSLLKGHWLITGVGSLILVAAAVVLQLSGHHDLSQALFGLALATPFSLLNWFGRRVAYLQSRPQTAAVSSLFYCFFVVTGLLGLAQTQRLSLFNAFVVVAISGALSGLWLIVKLLRPTVQSSSFSLSSTSIKSTHWQYGRWALANALLMWVPLNFFFVVLSIAVSFEASATLKAISNLVLPLLQANAAFATLLLPALTARAHNSNQFNRWVGRALAYFAGMALIYGGFLATFGHSLVHTLYNGKYDSEVSLLWFLLLIPILDGMTVVFSTATRAQERPDRIFWSQLVTAVFVLIVGVASTRSFGLMGAAVTIVVGNLIGLAILVVSQRSHRTRQSFPATVPSTN